MVFIFNSSVIIISYKDCLSQSSFQLFKYTIYFNDNLKIQHLFTNMTKCIKLIAY
jgi:hypothetical protein